MKSMVLKLIRTTGWFWARLNGCKVGSGVLFNGLPYLRRKGTGRIVLGDDVTINSTRWSNWLGSPGTMVLNVEDGATLELKRGSGVSASQLVANVGIEIGEESLIGAGCLICDSDMHEVPLGSVRSVRMAPICIGPRVFVGARSVILKGVTIGEGAVVAAGSVVTRDVAAETLVAGNPAREIRQLEVETRVAPES